jgi:hypothetical protein
MRCEVLKQANENEETNLEVSNVRFLEHVQKFEEQIRNNQVDKPASQMSGLPADGLKVLQKRSMRDFKPLKTKTFMFEKDEGAINR